ncbi:zinc finger CCCH domain-containing protein 3 isoform X2 [Pithys albifrons albifrons]|uniref:zinc finger CCCH domain-containing protein 3 isoform X2 n=1 Tax=Pithys albifrons albifrons TaxID=3385563 RepID=UPI003A5CC5C6
MEERERLCREIRALQGLIQSHRNIHGDIPRPIPRWNNPRNSRYTRRGGTFSNNFQPPRNFHPHQTSSWRKKYSLDNRLVGSNHDLGSNSGSSRGFGNSAAIPEPPERHVDLTRDGNIVVDIQVLQRAGNLGYSQEFSRQEATDPSDGGRKIPEFPTGNEKEEERPSLSISFNSNSRRVCLPGSGFSPSGSENAVTLKSEPEDLLEFPAGNSGWIKPESPGTGKSLEEIKENSRHPKFPGNAEIVQGNPGKGFSITPKVSALPRAASTPISGKTPKFRKTNYTWVANPGKNSRIGKSPRGENPRKGIGMDKGGAKTSPRVDLGSKGKKSGMNSKVGISPSKYKWKASNLQGSPSTSKWEFRWKSQDQGKAPALPIPGKTSGETSGYKVRSRTKIVRRKGNVGFPPEKKSPSPATALRSRFQLRARNSGRGKTSGIPKRSCSSSFSSSSSRILVQISRHRLRRIPATRTHLGSKEGAASPLARSPPANKVIKTRYRIVKKNVVTPSLSSFSSPIPTWKSRRPGTSRSLLLTQPRPSAPGAKSQPWRSKGFRTIGGVLYRVSANKLSRTSSTPSRTRELSTKTPSRAALRFHSTPSPGVSPSGLGRSSTSRSIASRAVQRSLAIIRQARQRRKRKEFCMYYNRFGRCNRGESCPFIHDPEKVAVCTRFLRGTCKKTDGTCPFSHKVSKDKMPVCSYFLRGICSNPSCPFSHVYVSRKAEVCPEFLKGYCPRGEKCKKKHTLVCPDFARNGVCPKGLRCKLLHPQKRRHPKEVGEDGESTHPLAKWRRIREESERNDPTQLQDDDGEIPGPSNVEVWKEEEEPKPTSCLQKLPSFISLRSPEYSGSQACKVEKDEDEPEDEPGTTKRRRIFPGESLEDSENIHVEGAKGKRLQIKPRL